MISDDPLSQGLHILNHLRILLALIKSKENKNSAKRTPKCSAPKAHHPDLISASVCFILLSERFITNTSSIDQRALFCSDPLSLSLSLSVCVPLELNLSILLQPQI